MIAKENFLEKYNISEELFVSAGISWEDLCEIQNDFQEKTGKYEKILDEFINIYLKDINKKKEPDEEIVKVHSFRARIKDPEHLAAKIIRKKQENHVKYQNLDKTNYEKFVTDLIGIRCLVLFKADWKGFHNYILSKFENNVNYYITDCLLDFDSNINHYYFAEKPKVHIRNGDSRQLYDEVLPPDCIIDGKVYRSVHYIIKYKGVYLEIQVRTLFEEGWGEIDHAVVYPYFQDDKILKEYTELLNRLSGLADEMSGFFYRLKELESEHINQMPQGKAAIEKKESNPSGAAPHIQDARKDFPAKSIGTPQSCLESIMDE